ncbi:AtzE family amidohydrolase [Bordetella genomosp. 13]|uniref:AtzE family amidohydrolase n=1 Tax=Bordetella genomosp. 13 TaxID=463040 RepID=UPI00119EC846|nr:AtzE family amidohydrolase [Bordetella genomosp. 13]
MSGDWIGKGVGAVELARRVRDGQCRAVDLLDACLAAIEAREPTLNAFTHVTHQRARREAEDVDARRARGDTLPPLAGVPYAAKNLFDVTGVATLAGGRVNASDPPAADDATAVARLRQAGAVLVGLLNMDEHAYGFTTENSHYGATRNPHDASRVAGGSSGGSGAAVGAGLVPFALGTDTNGSVRVPASLCGIYGHKPTYGRLPRGGVFPFAYSLDHVGVLASSPADVALTCDVMQGADPRDPAAVAAPGSLARPALPDGLRVGVLGGWFERWAGLAARQALGMAADALQARGHAVLEGAESARSAAFVITGAEGGALHRARLRTHYDQYEPHSRDRLIAGSLLPAAWVQAAQQVRRQVYEEAMRLFEHYDLLLAPATPVEAPPIGAAEFDMDGERLPARASLGLLTQPLSCIGLPVCTAPVWPAGAGGLPIGVQLIAAPWRDDLCLAAAMELERLGVARCAP